MHEYTNSQNQAVLVSAPGDHRAMTSAAPHLVPLPDEPWTLWRWAGVRGAGFPIAQVLGLATPACAAAADRLIEAAARRDEAHAAVLDVLRQAADHAEPSERLVLIRALQSFKKGKGSLPDLDSVNAAAHDFAAASEHYAAAQADFQQSFAAASQQLSATIRMLASDNQLREAITWQNHHAVATGLDALLRTAPGAISSKIRQKEALIASYVQRYSTKNDTIGFFGPVGWAMIQPDAPALTLHPGAQLLAMRRVYFETWCIDALAETLSNDPALLPWIAPQRMPFVRIDGTTLHVPLAGPIKLKPAQAAVLAACDGTRSAREIAQTMLADRSLGFGSEGDVYAALKQLQRLRRITWALAVPSDDAYPERRLRQQLSRIADPALQQSACAALDELEAARDAVAQAGGDAARLQTTFERLENTFTRLTGAEATRNAGKTYAARTLVYEDCRRDVEIELGAELLRDLAPPLGLFLTSTRWLTYKTAQSFRRAFRAIYDDLAAKSGTRRVEFAMFWLMAQSLLTVEGPQIVDALVTRLQTLWTDEILAIPDGQRCVSYSSAALRADVLRTFSAPTPGWQAARYQSPDIMIAAESVAAIQRGDYQLVMGEFHVGLNTLNASLFVQQHPNPEQLLAATEHDLPQPVIVPLAPKQWPAPTTRVLPMLTAAKDVRLATGVDACAAPNDRVLPSAALVIEAIGSELIVRTRDGAESFEIIEVFAEYVTGQVMSAFKPIAPRSYLPRIVIDRLVVSRETWSFPATELAFAGETVDAARFVAARSWAQHHGLPRWVFVKAPVEQKPFYVDLQSPIYIDNFARVVRRCQEQTGSDSLITVSEMLPGPDQLWLSDAHGQRYTSEIRFVAVDAQT